MMSSGKHTRGERSMAKQQTVEFVIQEVYGKDDSGNPLWRDLAVEKKLKTTDDAVRHIKSTGMLGKFRVIAVRSKVSAVETTSIDVVEERMIVRRKRKAKAKDEAPAKDEKKDKGDDQKG